jgi:transposase
LPDNQCIEVANDRVGQKALVRWIGKQNGSLVVFEATGAYHRHLEAALAANGTAFAKVNPRQARRFAEATGRLAKTDRVDAKQKWALFWASKPISRRAKSSIYFEN